MECVILDGSIRVYFPTGLPIIAFISWSFISLHIRSYKSVAKEDVIIFCLPSRTTSDSQPPVLICFGVLKVHWSDACHQYMFYNTGHTISEF